jgi:hypothetical protein
MPSRLSSMRKLSLLRTARGRQDTASTTASERGLLLYSAQKEIQLLQSSLHLDVDPLGVVAHQSRQPVPPRQR